MRLGLRSMRMRAASPRGGPSLRRLGWPVAPSPQRLLAPRSLRSGRGTALLGGLSLLTLAVIVLLLLASGPETPDPPRASAPPLDLPRASLPHVGVPEVDAPPLRINPPPLSAPTIGSPPAIGLPNINSDDGDSGSSNPIDEGPERRTERIHVHHRLWIWDIDPLLLAILLGGSLLVWVMSRRIRPGQHLLAGSAAIALTSLAVLAFVVGITQGPGPGTYYQRAPEIERSEDLILTKIETDHYHAPTYLELHWLIAGICLALLAIPPGRIAVAPQRRSRSTT